jgi:hypothetical protein
VTWQLLLVLLIQQLANEKCDHPDTNSERPTLLWRCPIGEDLMRRRKDTKNTEAADR